MRLRQLIEASNQQKLDNIEAVLQMTDDEELVKAAEKMAGQVQTGEDVGNKANRIAAIMAALENSNDPSQLDYIESVLKKQELINRVDRIWNARNFNSGRMSKYKGAFRDLMLHTNSSLKSKIQFMYMISSNKTAIPASAFAQSFTGTIDDVVPSAFAGNATYQAIKDTIFFNDAFRGKGIGPAEFGLALLGKNGAIVDHAGDVMIDGHGVEIKGGGGGSIKTGSPNSFRAADELRDWIGKQVGVELDRTNKIKWEKPTEFAKAFMALDTGKRSALAKEYVTRLYPAMDSGDQQNLINGLIQDTGSPEVKVHFGRALLNSYKKQDEWNSILFIHPSGRMTNVVDASDAGLLDFALAGTNRDGDTQALPDGYINGKLRRG